MKSRKRLTLNDWSRIPTVAPGDKTGGYETRQQFFEREAREEKERQEAPIREAQTELNRNLAKLNKQIAAAWSQPIPELVAALQRRDAALEDTLLSVPQGRCTRESTQKAAQKWNEGFAASPHALTELGQQRLTLYGLFAIATGYKMDTIEAWQTAFDRLRALNAFAANEITFDQSKVEPEPQPAPTLSAHDQLYVDMLDEMFPIAKEWAESLRQKFGYVITEADRELIFGTDSKSALAERRGLFYILNLNPLDRRSYDKIRRYMCDRGYWNSEQLLDADETFSRAIESETTPLSRLSGESRQTLVSSLNLLRR